MEPTNRRVNESARGIKLSRKDFLRIAAAVGSAAAVSALISACGGQSPTTPPSTGASASPPSPTNIAAPTVVKKTTTLTLGIGGDVPSLNVLERTEAVAIDVYPAMWDPWMEADFGSDGALKGMKPLLMTDWKVISDDKLTWQFKLREGVKFDNGDIFDAESAKFSLDTMMTSKTTNATPKALLGNLFDSSAIVDKLTLNVKTKQPFVITPLVFAQFFTVPAAYYQSNGADSYAQKPVGIGQYRFVEWRKGEHIVLERNPNYWGEKATIDTLIFKPIPEDATRVAALQAGEIDVAVLVPPDNAKQLADKGMQVSSIPVGQAMNLTMKLTIQSPLTDKRVRQAMNYAIDKDTLVNSIMLGYTKKLEGQIVGPSSTGYTPTIKAYPYDPAKAKQLLADAGYPDGLTVDFDTSQGQYAKQKEVSEWLVGEFAKVGIKLNMHLYEASAYQVKIFSDQAAPVFYTGRNWYPIMDDEQCINMFECADRRKQMCEPEYEQLIAAERTGFDPAARKVSLAKIHAYLNDYSPVVWLFQSPGIYGLSKRVRNFTPTPDNRIHFQGVTVADS